jgi:hypothetical protein
MVLVRPFNRTTEGQMQPRIPIVVSTAVVLLAIVAACTEEPIEPWAPSGPSYNTNGVTDCPIEADFVVSDEVGLLAALAAANPGEVIGLDGFFEVTAQVDMATQNITLTCATPGSGIFTTLPLGILLRNTSPGDEVAIDRLVFDGRTTSIPVYNSGDQVQFSNNTVKCGSDVCAFFPSSQNAVVVDNYFIAEEAPNFSAFQFQSDFSGSRLEGNTIITSTPNPANRGRGVGLIPSLDPAQVLTEPVLVKNNVVTGPFVASFVAVGSGFDTQITSNQFGGADLYHVSRNVITDAGTAGLLLNNGACSNFLVRNNLDGNSVSAIFDDASGLNHFVGDPSTVVDLGDIDCDGDGTIDPNIIRGPGSGGPPGVPALLFIVSGENLEGIVGRPVSPPFVVAVRDSRFKRVPGVEVSWSVTQGGGSLSAATTTTDVNGETAVTLTLGSATGTNEATASISGLNAVSFTAEGEAGTGVFGFINSNNPFNVPAYDLTIQGRNGSQDPRLPAIADPDAAVGELTGEIPGLFGTLGVLVTPGVLAPMGFTHIPADSWDLFIKVTNLNPNTRYTVILARQALRVNGALDVEQVVNGVPVTAPDELVLLDGTGPDGHPNTPCDFSTAVPVLATANPLVLGFFDTDDGGSGIIDCVPQASGQWWADDSEPVPPGVENLAPFIPNSLITSIGRFDLPSFNYLYLVEGQGTAMNPVPPGPPVLRWQIGIDLDLAGNPIPFGFAPFPVIVP